MIKAATSKTYSTWLVKLLLLTAPTPNADSSSLGGNQNRHTDSAQSPPRLSLPTRSSHRHAPTSVPISFPTPISTTTADATMPAAPRGPALWLRRARELLSDLQAHAHAQTASASASPSAGASHAPPFRPPDWLRPPWDPPPNNGKERGEGWGGSAFRTPAPPHHHQQQHRHHIRQDPAWLTPNTAAVPKPATAPGATPEVGTATAREMACAEPGCAIPAAVPDAGPAMREDECGTAMREVLRSVAQVSLSTSLSFSLDSFRPSLALLTGPLGPLPLPPSASRTVPLD